MPHAGKPLVWLHGEIKTPPLSAEARLEAGLLLRQLQQGERLGDHRGGFFQEDIRNASISYQRVSGAIASV